jgi:hypothetical protein
MSAADPNSQLLQREQAHLEYMNLGIKAMNDKVEDELYFETCPVTVRELAETWTLSLDAPATSVRVSGTSTGSAVQRVVQKSITCVQPGPFVWECDDLQRLFVNTLCNCRCLHVGAILQPFCLRDSFYPPTPFRSNRLIALHPSTLPNLDPPWGLTRNEEPQQRQCIKHCASEFPLAHTANSLAVPPSPA